MDIPRFEIVLAAASVVVVRFSTDSRATRIGHVARDDFEILPGQTSKAMRHLVLSR